MTRLECRNMWACWPDVTLSGVPVQASDRYNCLKRPSLGQRGLLNVFHKLMTQNQINGLILKAGPLHLKLFHSTYLIKQLN
jgi:hypothetical protein